MAPAEGEPWRPQAIVRDADEAARLFDALQGLGHTAIDLNLGCPFPMQVHAGRGSGLLAHADRVGAILDEAARRPECRFSAKMRLGWDSAEEATALLPLLNASCLDRIVLHPRLGRQQYKGVPDLEAFDRFHDGCTKPLVYNGDIATAADAREVTRRWPGLAGLMVGRGLLANPLLAREMGGEAHSTEERTRAFMAIHDALLRHATQTLQGDSQVLSHMRALWEYPPEGVDARTVKRLRKSGTLRTYREALRGVPTGTGTGSADREP